MKTQVKADKNLLPLQSGDVEDTFANVYHPKHMILPETSIVKE